MAEPEEWRPVPGYEGLYSVSSLGRVRSERRGEILRPQRRSRRGPRMVALSAGGEVEQVGVPTLVAAAFLGPKPEGMVVRRADDDREDYRVSNLYYGEPGERPHAVEGKPEMMRLLREEGWSQKAVAERFGVSQTYVGRLARSVRSSDPPRQKRIRLLDGSFAKVSPEDHERLSAHRWTRIRQSSSPPVRREGPKGAQELVWMHREVLGLPRGEGPGSKKLVKFRNGNPLDCRRQNLYVVTTAQSRQAAPPSKRKPDSPYSSRYVGVTRYEKAAVRWEAGINVDGRRVRLGRFDTEEEAALAYDRAARERYGPNARTNFPAEVVAPEAFPEAKGAEG